MKRKWFLNLKNQQKHDKWKKKIFPSFPFPLQETEGCKIASNRVQSLGLSMELKGLKGSRGVVAGETQGPCCYPTQVCACLKYDITMNATSFGCAALCKEAQCVHYTA